MIADELAIIVTDKFNNLHNIDAYNMFCYVSIYYNSTIIADVSFQDVIKVRVFYTYYNSKSEYDVNYDRLVDIDEFIGKIIYERFYN